MAEVIQIVGQKLYRLLRTEVTQKYVQKFSLSMEDFVYYDNTDASIETELFGDDSSDEEDEDQFEEEEFAEIESIVMIMRH